MKKMILKYLIALALLLFQNNNQAQKVDKKLNVVVILADDLGWMDLQCQGSKVFETPNIDRLASEGIRFEQAYCAYPRCVPSRYGLITGRYPARVKLPGPWGWEGTEYTMAQAFKDAGYKTFFTGKWHLAKDEVMPENKGFDINIAGGEAGAPPSYFYPYKNAKSKERNIIGLEEGGKPGEYLPDRLTDETIKFIKENKDKNFFVYLSHYSVHAPFEAKEKDVKYFKEKISKIKFDGDEYIPEGSGFTLTQQNNPVYAAMIKSLDESVGRVLSLLKELNLEKNTIIVFTSDNGGLSNRGYNQRQLATSNLPLRAGKGHGYEGGIRIPMIYKWPSTAKAGEVNNAVVSTIDIYPTVVTAAGIQLKKEYEMDGTNIVNLLKGSKQDLTKRPLFWHSPESRPYSTGDTSFSAIRLGDYKLIDFYDNKVVELYNITKDISEKNNIADTEKEKKEELLTMLNNWKKKTEVYYDTKKNKKRKQANDD